MKLASIFLLFSLLAATWAEEDDHDDHDHDHDEEHSSMIEWIAVYDIEEHDDHDDHDDHDGHDHRRYLSEDEDEHEDHLVYSLQLYKNDGESFSDAYMFIGCVKVDAADEDHLEEAEESFEHELEEIEEGTGNFTVVAPFAEIHCHDEVEIYKLSLNETEGFAFHALLEFEGHGAYAMFAQHMPTEFADPHAEDVCSGSANDATSAWFLRDMAGEYVTPTVEEMSGHHDDEDEDKPWGTVIAASIVSAVPSLIGIFALVPFLSTLVKSTEFAGNANSFASGVLLAAAAFLLLPEALHLVATGHDEEAAATGDWGTMVIVAVLMCFILHGLTKIFEAASTDKKAYSAAATSETKKGEEAENGPDGIQPIAFMITVGDFMHNVADGIFIAAAFSGCSDSFGWEITAITVAHEVPQEIADFLALVTAGNMKAWQALLINFAASSSAVIGAVIFLASDTTDHGTGMALAFGGGCYLYVGLCELTEVMFKTVDNAAKLLARLAFFSLGTIAIGLILLDHEHCSSGGGHDHHDH